MMDAGAAPAALARMSDSRAIAMSGRAANFARRTPEIFDAVVTALNGFLDIFLFSYFCL
jgi:hypothetical protein